MDERPTMIIVVGCSTTELSGQQNEVAHGKIKMPVGKTPSWVKGFYKKPLSCALPNVLCDEDTYFCLSTHGSVR